MNSITHKDDKKKIISEYEIGLTEILLDNGFKYDTLIKGYERINNPTILKWRQIILKQKMPFIKCSLPRLINKDTTTVEGYEEVIKSVGDYPVQLIHKNTQRLVFSRKGKHTSPLFIKRIYFGILAEFPFFLRKIIALFVSKFLPFLRD